MIVNPWEHFGIKSVSPSQITNFNEEPARWFARSVRRLKEDAGPAAWRGEAIEAGLYAFLLGRPNASDTAERTYEQRSKEWSDANDGEVHPSYDDEYQKVGLGLQRAIAAANAEGMGQPAAYQLTLEGFLPGYDKVKFWQKPDFAYEGFTLDLKTSTRIPSIPARKDDGDEHPTQREPEAKPDHAMAFACYAGVRGDREARALYVSVADKPKVPHVMVRMNADQVDRYVSHAIATLQRMEETMKAALALAEYEATTPEAALARLCRPNLLAMGGGTYSLWKEDYTRAAAEAVPEWGLFAND